MRSFLPLPSIALLGSFFAITVLAGCGEPTRTTPVAAVEIAVAWPYLNVGDTLTLTPTILDPQGKPLAGRDVTWSSSDRSIATVSGGVVTGIAPGEVTISAEVQGERDEVRLTVEYRPVSVELVGGLISLLAPGGTVELAACALRTEGPRCGPHSIRWTSSAPEVATVTDSGRVEARGPGEAVISAHAGSVRADFTVEVVRPYTLTTFGTFRPRALNNLGVLAGTQDTSAAVWENGVVTVLGPGVATDVNDAGQVVGQSGQDAVLWEDGTSTVLLRPTDAAFDSAVALSVSARGEVLVEEYHLCGGSCRSSRFSLWHAGALTVLDLPGALAVADGAVIGNEGDPGRCRSTGLVYRDGVRTSLPSTEAGGFSAAYGINARGEVVGTGGPACDARALLWPSPGAQPQSLVPFYDGVNSSASAINTVGHVVGTRFGQPRWQGVLWRNGRMGVVEQLQSDESWEISRAFAINDRGEILAHGKNRATGEAGVVLLSPAK